MREYTYTTCKTITVKDIYGKDITDVPSYKIIDFRPVQKGDSYLSSAPGNSVLKSNFDEKEKSAPRLILYKVKENKLDLKKLFRIIILPGKGGEEERQIFASDVYKTESIIIPEGYEFSKFDFVRPGDIFFAIYGSETVAGEDCSYMSYLRIILKKVE